jgi:hypothetical protein
MSLIQGEYLVFEKSDNQIQPISSPEKHAAIYQILMKYQWPMSTSSFAQMTQGEIKELTTQKKPAAEEEFIRKKLKELDTSLDIVFVPTFVYELYVIYYFMNLQKTTSQSYWQLIKEYVGFEQTFGASPIPVSTYIFKLLKSKNKSSWQDLLNVYKSLNNNKDTREMHYVINNNLIKFIEPIDQENLAQNYFIDIARKLIALLQSEKGIARISQLLFKQGQVEKSFALTKDFLQSNLAENIISIEYQAHHKNKGLLYRANLETNPFYLPGKSIPIVPLELPILIKNLSTYKPITDEQIKSEAAIPLKNLAQKYIDWNVPSRSISYGNSLFGGYFYDYGACVYWLSLTTPILYTLFIDKFSYSMDIINQFFFISPLNTINALFTSGELFHSRTISYYYKDSHRSYAKGLIGYADLLLGFFIREGNVLKNAYELSQFIEKNAYVLRGSFDPNADDQKKKELLEGQKDLTKLLNFMNLLSMYSSNIMKTLAAKKTYPPKVINYEDID